MITASLTTPPRPCPRPLRLAAGVNGPERCFGLVLFQHPRQNLPPARLMLAAAAPPDTRWLVDCVTPLSVLVAPPRAGRDGSVPVSRLILSENEIHIP